MNPHKVNELVPSHRKWLDKFQEYLTTTLAYLVKAKRYLHTGEVQIYMNKGRLTVFQVFS